MFFFSLTCRRVKNCRVYGAVGKRSPNCLNIFLDTSVESNREKLISGHNISLTTEVTVTYKSMQVFNKAATGAQTS